MSDDKILDKVHATGEFFNYLSGRWMDEHEYEDLDDYKKAFEKNGFVVESIAGKGDEGNLLNIKFYDPAEPTRLFEWKSEETTFELLEHVREVS